MMRNIYIFRASLFTLALLFTFFCSQSLRAQTTLGAGDIAFTLMNLDGSDTDAFGFVLLSDVVAGTVIRVTDKEYTTGMGFETSEGILNITFDSAFPCGTEIIFTDMDPNSAVFDFQANLAGITTTASPNNGLQLSTSGETLIAFQSDNLTNPPAGSFLTALANTGAGFGIGGPTGSSDLPPGLTVGTSAMVMTSDPDGNEWDNIKYDCSTVANADLDALRMAIYTPANWLTDNDDPLPTMVCDPAFSCSDPCTDLMVAFMPSVDEFCAQPISVTGLTGGTPTGGTYSGPGVTDEGNGTSFSFDPTAAGVGMHTLTYDYTAPDGCSGSATATVTVFATPMVSSFSAPDSVSVNAPVSTGLGNATPAGGVYSGPGVTDDGNGFTYSFNPDAAGVGTHTITYTVTDANGCVGVATEEVDVFQLPISAIDDIDEVDANGVAVMSDSVVAVQGIVHCIDFSEGMPIEFWIMEAGGSGISVFSSNPPDGYTVTEGDELYIEGTLSTFNGLLDLLPNYIEVVSQGNALNTPIEVMELGEEEESKYVTLTGATVPDGEMVQEVSGGFEFEVTTAGMNPLTISVQAATGIDTSFLNGFLADAASMGNNFTITGIVTQIDNSQPFTGGYQLWPCNQDDFNIVVSVQEPSWAADLVLFPNPTSGILHMQTEVDLEAYRLLDLQGRLLQAGQINGNRHRLDVAHLPQGMYQLQLISGGELVTRRVVKE